MTVAFDSNGNPYDIDTGQPVSLVYDGAGNAIDQNTNTLVDTIISPDQQTVYTQSQNPSTWSQTAQQLLLNATAQRQGYYQPYTPPYMTAYPTPYSSTYPPGYRPSPVASGVSVGAGASGVGLNISPTTLLIIAVVGAAFLFGKKGR